MRAHVSVFLMTLAMALQSSPAQVIRIASLKPRPQLTLGDSLTVSATPSVVSITLVPKGTAVASSSISITTTSTGVSLFSSLGLYAYFASASTALSGGSPVSYIPSSVIYGQCPTGTPTAYTSFTSTEPVGGASAGLQIFFTNVGLSLGASRTDVLSLEVNLSSLPQQPAATYTGSLFLEAQAF